MTDDLLPHLPVPQDAGPHPDAAEREARWAQLNQRAQLSVHPGEESSWSLYADHPSVRAELATLAAAEAKEHPELDIAALIGDDHLILAVRLREEWENDD